MKYFFKCFAYFPCNTCNAPWNCTQAIYDDYTVAWKVALAQRTYANLFGNSNWARFIEFMKTYEKGFFVVTSGREPTDLPIKERFLIDAQLVNQWDSAGEAETERLMQFIADKKGELICFSAGPLSKVWVPLCMARNPTNIYLDVGASLDRFTKGDTNRQYTTPTARFATSTCRFNPLNLSLRYINPPPTKKNLVYLSVFHERKYVELLKILMLTVKYFSKTETMDFLVLTSPAFVPLIQELAAFIQIPIGIKVFNFTTMQEACCARLHIFDYEHIASYDKILYIDTDIIVQNDITTLFDHDLEDKIYALKEGSLGIEWFGGWFFDFTVFDRAAPAINSGILLFKNTERVRQIFTDIIAHIDGMLEQAAPMPKCHDQAFISYHIIRAGIHDTSLLDKYALIITDTPQPPPLSPTSIIFCHFAWPIGDAAHKKTRMIKHLDHLFTNYAAIYGGLVPEKNPVKDKTFSWNGNGTIRFTAEFTMSESESLYNWLSSDVAVDGSTVFPTTLVTSWGRGVYKWMGLHILEASWSIYSHILLFNEDYTSFIYVRKGDCEYGYGQKTDN